MTEKLFVQWMCYFLALVRWWVVHSEKNDSMCYKSECLKWGLKKKSYIYLNKVLLGGVITEIAISNYLKLVVWIAISKSAA